MKAELFENSSISVEMLLNVMYLTKSEVCIDNIEQSISAFNRVVNNYSEEEIKAIAKLNDTNEPMTIIELLRFKHRVVAEVFLENMNVFREDFEHFSDSELGKYMFEKVLDSNFRNKIERKFPIDTCEYLFQKE